MTGPVDRRSDRELSAGRARLGFWLGGDCVALAVLVTLWCVGVAVMSAGKMDVGDPMRVDAARVARVREHIDPNTASILSLRRVPRIGEARARAIVAFREQAGGGIVFRSAEDLMAVKGIGVATVRDAAGALSWPARPAAAGGP